MSIAIGKTERTAPTEPSRGHGVDSEAIASKTQSLVVSRTAAVRTGPLAMFEARRQRTARVKPADLILFATQLSVMLDSGVVLSDALDAIAEQSPDATFKMIIMNVAEAVKSGEPLSSALIGYPRVFDPMFISMVKASEASGRMTEMLGALPWSSFLP